MGGAKRKRRKTSVLERLSADEAQDVLHRLLTAHPELGAEAEATARSHLGHVSCERVADEIDEAIATLDIEELNRRAGRHAWGYVEPSEAAWEILEEAVEPFVADIKRRMELGLEADALEICKGVVLGLHRVEQGKVGGVLEWAPDFPAEAAGNAIATWRAADGPRKAPATGGRNRPAFPREFVDRLVPEWRDMIARALSQKG